MFTIHFRNTPPSALLALANEKSQQGTLANWEKEVWSFLSQWCDATSDVINVNTSGSTGTPKNISLQKTKMVQSAIHTINALQLNSNDIACLCLPASKIGGMMMIVRAITLGIELICIQPTANPWGDIAKLKNISFLACTPMQLAASFDNTAAAQHINTILLGGGPVTAWMKPHISKFENNVYHTFGMTETISHIALKKLSGVAPDSCFVVIGDTSVAVDERQCLIITAPSLDIHQLVTNDVVELHSSTKFEWLGRYDHVINTGGLKIYPEQLEAQLHANLQYDFFVFGKADNMTGEKICIAVPADVDQTELNKTISMLPKNSRPKSIYFIEKMIYTTTGKIDRTQSLEKISLIM